MFGMHGLIGELREIKIELNLIYTKLNELQGQMDALKSQRNDILLPEELDKEKQAINALYKTKQGLFSFKKAKRAIKEL